MLVLTRKTIERDQSESKIRIHSGGVEIMVTLLEIRDRGTARIGIEAPKEFNIVRTEIDISNPTQEGRDAQDAT